MVVFMSFLKTIDMIVNVREIVPLHTKFLIAGSKTKENPFSGKS